jgi:hypothetical protein
VPRRKTLDEAMIKSMIGRCENEMGKEDGVGEQAKISTASDAASGGATARVDVEVFD